MHTRLRFFLIASGLGVLVGILSAIDPILPVTKLVTSSSVLRAIYPVLIAVRFLLWSGLLAAIGGLFIGYRERKRNTTAVMNYGKAVIFGWGIWLAVASYFVSIAALMIVYPRIRDAWLQQLNNQFTSGGVGFGKEATIEGIIPSIVLITLVVVFVLGIYNVGVSLAASWFGVQLAKRNTRF